MLVNSLRGVLMPYPFYRLKPHHRLIDDSSSVATLAIFPLLSAQMLITRKGHAVAWFNPIDIRSDDLFSRYIS